MPSSPEQAPEPRPWQRRALPRIVDRIRGSQVATVAAAPGAGKTVFAGLVFEELKRQGLVERMVVLVPRRALVKQWHRALFHTLAIQLRPNATSDRTGEQGVAITYQSLGGETVGLHRRQAERAKTLFVLDEVHHVGEPTDDGDRRAWARHVCALVGDVNEGIDSGMVLNLSGTLWRSKATERISTVRYVTEADGRLLSDVDFEVTAEQLIREGQLRPVDLFRRGATVEVVDLAKSTRLISEIADLDEPAIGRVAIRDLPRDAEWRDKFVVAVLERLALRQRDLGSRPAKALIVARSQEDARAFQESANRLMEARGLGLSAELAISDEPDSEATLERFRRLEHTAVLCTVDMAGEGYDCPDIVVVGFATNKLTPLYVRQVVARAQRVTDHERLVLGRPLPAAVVIPEVPELVEVMTEILQPMRHELDDESQDPPEFADEGEQGALPGLQMGPAYLLDRVDGHADGHAHVTGEADGDVAMALVRLVEPEAKKVGLPESDAPRIILAMQNAMKEQGLDVASSHVSTSPSRSQPIKQPVSIDDQVVALRNELSQMARWWHRYGATSVQEFNVAVNRAGGIPTGGRADASIEKLKRANEHARRLISDACRTQGLKPPRLRPLTNR